MTFALKTYRSGFSLSLLSYKIFLWILGLVISLSVACAQSTTTTLTITPLQSSAPLPANTPITLTATVTRTDTLSPVSPGLVKFCNASAPLCVGDALIGTAQLLTTGTNPGTASIHLLPGGGSHSYIAVFTGTPRAGGGMNIGSSQSAAQTVAEDDPVPFSTATTIAASGTTGNYTLTATVTSTGSFRSNYTPPSVSSFTPPLLFTPQLTGTVNFFDTFSGNTSPIGNSVLTNPPTGSRTFPQANGSPFPLPSAKGIATGDFNRDGIPDLVITSSSDTVVVELGNGNGTFTASAPITVGTGPAKCAVGDYNGDGYQDIAVSNYGSNLGSGSTYSILLGNGDGTFQPTSTYPFNQTSANYVATGDFNGDGIADLVIAASKSTNNVVIYLGIGDGTFTYSNTFRTWNHSTTHSSTPSGIGMADFNGDGKLDLALPADDAMPIFLGNGDGTFTEQPDYVDIFPGHQANLTDIKVGDFNKDGKADIALAPINYPTGALVIVLGKGDGTMNAPVFYNPGNVGGQGYSIDLADFDGDGNTDIFATDYSYKRAVFWLGDGLGGFKVAPWSGISVVDARQTVTGTLMEMACLTSPSREPIRIISRFS